MKNTLNTDYVGLLINKDWCTQIREASALSLVQRILVHIRCAQRAHHMFMYAQLARTDFSTHKCTEVISAFVVVFVVQAGQHSSLHQLNITMFNTQCNIQSCNQRSLYRLQSWSID